jgi:hypothetical protein
MSALILRAGALTHLPDGEIGSFALTPICPAPAREWFRPLLARNFRDSVREALTRLHLVAAQILVVQPLEPAAELFGGGALRWPAGIQLGRFHYFFIHVDRTISP